MYDVIVFVEGRVNEGGRERKKEKEKKRERKRAQV